MKAASAASQLFHAGLSPRDAALLTLAGGVDGKNGKAAPFVPAGVAPGLQ